MDGRLITKTCPCCGVAFTTFASQNKWCCSAKCSWILRKKNTRTRKQRPCQICGTLFVPKHTKAPGWFCSTSCRGKAQTKQRVGKPGHYIRVFCPTHPHATKQGYVLEHRLVMEKRLGRVLAPDETVHHVNHIKSDNEDSNLVLMGKSEHRSMHGREGKETQMRNRAKRRFK